MALQSSTASALARFVRLVRVTGKQRESQKNVRFQREKDEM
jgi:hypothetical protein